LLLLLFLLLLLRAMFRGGRPAGMPFFDGPRPAQRSAAERQDPDDQGNMPIELLSLSRNLARLLRHRSAQQGLLVNEEGWVEVRRILTLPEFRSATVDDIVIVVSESFSKRTKRFELQEVAGTTCVRAAHKRGFFGPPGAGAGAPAQQTRSPTPPPLGVAAARKGVDSLLGFTDGLLKPPPVPEPDIDPWAKGLGNAWLSRTRTPRAGTVAKDIEMPGKLPPSGGEAKADVKLRCYDMSRDDSDPEELAETADLAAADECAVDADADEADGGSEELPVVAGRSLG